MTIYVFFTLSSNEYQISFSSSFTLPVTLHIKKFAITPKEVYVECRPFLSRFLEPFPKIFSNRVIGFFVINISAHREGVGGLASSEI